MLENKSGNISETHKDRGKVNIQLHDCVTAKRNKRMYENMMTIIPAIVQN